jgi:tRNA-splicing ligase RtcB (3'-phosphate/5'-hydroxy nucleic acid ligase)
MKKVITSESKPIKLWLDDIEEGALDQAKNLANLPFIFKHVAIMPDSHQGYGMPIGGVLATKGVIIPNAVGVDIGCGMSAVRLDTDMIELPNFIELIKQLVPVGFSRHQKKQEWHGFNDAPDIPIIQQELEAAHYQLGTLGGGNHFIEIQKGSDGYIWIMLHSGSRNFGLKIANEYHKKAKQMCEKWVSDIPTLDLAFLPMDTAEGREYFEAMNYALRFARENRKLMMQNVLSLIPYKGLDGVNIHHNYAAYENHFNTNVIVHRKGATKATEGLKGIIPGSQGTKSYIVEGLGNPDSFMSCSHGAGRKMGRKQAQRELSFEDEAKKMEGIIHSVKSVDDLDEAPGAYKDIDVVMDNQKDLVKISVELTPLAVIKG